MRGFLATKVLSNCAENSFANTCKRAVAMWQSYGTGVSPPTGRTAALRPHCVMSSAPHLLAFDIHNKLLRCLSQEVHFNGLQLAGRHHLRAGNISKKFYRRLCNLDTTYNVMRHLTPAFGDSMVSGAETFMSQVDTTPAVVDVIGMCKEGLHDTPKKRVCTGWGPTCNLTCTEDGIPSFRPQLRCHSPRQQCPSQTQLCPVWRRCAGDCAAAFPI